LIVDNIPATKTYVLITNSLMIDVIDMILKSDMNMKWNVGGGSEHELPPATGPVAHYWYST
jgi:hypothetical protein